MRQKLVVRRRRADDDIQSAVSYYLDEAGTEVATAFLHQLEEAIRYISKHPAAGSQRYGHELQISGLRQWPIKRFPYLIFYVEKERCIEIQYDNDGKPVAPFKAGVDHLWITENPNARFGDFETVDLDQFLKVKDSFRIDIASVTGTPMYYLLPHSGGFPSGKALKKAETRFIAKVRDRQAAFGQTWSDVMAFALRLEGHGENRVVRTRWEDPAQLAERESLENILLKKQIGVSESELMREMGYEKNVDQSEPELPSQSTSAS